jgi:hypothetical protein
MPKTPTDVRSLARSYTDKALKVLAGITMQEDAPPAARVAAANSLLDRGWGKPAQPIEGGDAPVKVIHKIELIAKKPDERAD